MTTIATATLPKNVQYPQYDRSQLRSRIVHFGFGAFHRAHQALLTDRVLLARGKPQRYGTQLEGGMGAPLRLRPVEDPAGVDGRRAAMHLMPEATYLCAMQKMGGGGAGR